MTAISNRSPSVDIEYDRYGKRVRAHFQNSPCGARRFYALKLRAGKNPKVRKPNSMGYCSICRNSTPIRNLIERPPATGLFCPDCAARNSVPNRVYTSTTSQGT